MNEAKIVAVTEPRVSGVSTAEEFVAYCARVSNPTNQLNNETADKLLGYLIRNKHWSPFEMVSVVIEIKTTRDIGRQILRHRSFSFQEFSQRYAKIAVDDLVTREARLQDQKNRQNSIDIDDDVLKNEWLEWQKEVQSMAIRSYEWALENGVAKEQARAVLPEGMTPSTMYMSGTLRSWLHYCALRMGNGTQKEHRDVATNCFNELCDEFPSIVSLVE
jgi:thymidylate synthase (FAD)